MKLLEILKRLIFTGFLALFVVLLTMHETMILRIVETEQATPLGVYVRIGSGTTKY